MDNSTAALSDTLRALLAHYSQDTRFLRIHTPLGADVLLVESLTAREAVDECYRIELTVLSTDAHLELKRLIGQPVLVQLLSQHSRTDLRPFHGHVTGFEQLGSDGGFARFKVVIEPWLVLLAKRQDSFIFQDMSITEIIESVFADYANQGKLIPAWRFDLLDANLYTKRSLTIQYNESDYNFVCRLLAEEGLFFWFEHAGDVNSPQFGSHTLVIADHNGAFHPNRQAEVRYHRNAATETSDSIQHWIEETRTLPNAVELSSWDYRTLSTRPVTAADLTASTPRVTQQIPAGQYAYATRDIGQRYATRRLEAVDARAKISYGQGGVRTAIPATTFNLREHPRIDRQRVTHGDEFATFVLLAVEHQAQNNLSVDIKHHLERLFTPGAANPFDVTGQTDSDSLNLPKLEPGQLYRNSFSVMPAHRPYRPLIEPLPNTSFAQEQARAHACHGAPLAYPRHTRPVISGTHSAIVVGKPEQPLLTDRDHRIKIQFHWQRGERAHNRQPHPSGENNAPASAALGTWVRVATPLGGDNWGSSFVPRAGQEVAVLFSEGNIDRPLVMGSVYNGQGQPDAQHNQIPSGAGATTGNAPAWFAGSSGHHAHNAVLSGFKTQAMSASQTGSGGYNQLVFDDTPQQSRTQLASTQHASALTLGRLKHQQDNQRRQDLGHGVELITGAAGALRAGQGLLLSTDARPNASATQMDSREAQAQLEQSQQLTSSLAQTASEHHALPGAAAADLPAILGLSHSMKVLAQTHSGVAAPAGSEGAIKATGGGQGHAPAWSEPMLVVSSPAGIAALTPQQAILSAGQNISLAASDIDLMAQGNSAYAVKDGIRLFTYGKASNPKKPNQETGIKLHAASGQVAVEAHSDQIKLSADKAVQISSTQSSIDIAAPKHVLVTATGASIRLEGGNITIQAPGNVSIKASMKIWEGPKRVSYALPVMPGTICVECLKKSLAAAPAFTRLE